LALRAIDFEALDPVANPRGQFGTNAPQNGCGPPPQNGAPLMKKRLFLVSIEVETKTKIHSPK